MEYFDKISKWTETLNPIVQGLIGSAIFSLSIWIGRQFWAWLVQINKDLRIKRQKDEITKIILHKHYITHNGLYYYTQGYLRIIFKALFHLLKGLTFYFSMLAVDEIVNLPFITIIGIYFCVQELLSGLSWANPKWASKDLRSYDIDLANEVIEQFTSNDPLRGEREKDVKENVSS